MEDFSAWLSALDGLDFFLFFPVLCVIILGPIYLLSWFVAEFVLGDAQRAAHHWRKK